MLSSLNAFGGLSAADVLTLFGANSTSSSSSSAASASTVSSAATSIAASSANGAENAIQAILAQAQIDRAQMETSLGESASLFTAQAAYADQANGSGSLMSASVTISTPGALQQITDAVSEVDKSVYWEIGLNPATHNGISGESGPVDVTAADAVNITMSNGGMSVTAMEGAELPNGLPTLANIQQALGELKWEDEATGWNGIEGTPETNAKAVADAWWNSVSGNFTLVPLPANASGSVGGNMITFGSSDWGPLEWALVLPQDTVSVSVSDTEVRN